MSKETDEQGPGHGHTFRITASSRGSYKVVGDRDYHDAMDFGPNMCVEVRAWNLRDALHYAAHLSLDEWDWEDPAFPDESGDLVHEEGE